MDDDGKDWWQEESKSEKVVGFTGVTCDCAECHVLSATTLKFVVPRDPGYPLHVNEMEMFFF